MTPLITAPGIYPGITDEQYHADPCEWPSLNSSIAKILISKSPRHAWLAHPRLGAAKPDGEEEDENTSKEQEYGLVAHSLLLGRGARVVVAPFENWRTNAAKEMRESARKAGGIAVLPPVYDRARKNVDEARTQLDALGLQRVFREGQNEVTVVWREGEFYLRAKLDNLIINEADKTAEIWDLKTVSRSAHPKACAAQIDSLGYDLSGAFYKQGVQAVRPDLRQIKFRWVFLEIDPPFAATPVELDGEWETIAISKFCNAADGWKRCLKADRWPLYTDKVVRLEPKPWMLAQAIGAEQIGKNVA